MEKCVFNYTIDLGGETMEPLWTRPFIILTLTLFFLSLGFYLLLPALPIYILQQGISESHLGLIIGVFTMAAVVSRPFIGGLIDQFGRRIFIIVGLILFALSMVLYNWASGFILLMLLRIFHGFSWAVSTTSIGTSITDVIPASRRGEGMGWYGLSMTISMAIGPIIGIEIVQRYSFSNLFFLAATLTVMVFLFHLIIKVPFKGKKDLEKVEFFDKSVISISAAIFFLTFTYGGIITFFPLFPQSIQVNAGTFFLIYALVLTIIRPVAGKLADRYSEGTVIIPSLIIAILALLVLSLSKDSIGVIVSAILYGIGFGAAQPTLQAATLRLVFSHRKGVANASFFTALDFGIGLGAILLGPVSQYLGYSFLFTICAISGGFLYLYSSYL